MPVPTLAHVPVIDLSKEPPADWHDEDQAPELAELAYEVAAPGRSGPHGEPPKEHQW